MHRVTIAPGLILTEAMYDIAQHGPEVGPSILDEQTGEAYKAELTLHKSAVRINDTTRTATCGCDWCGGSGTWVDTNGDMWPCIKCNTGGGETRKN